MIMRSLKSCDTCRKAIKWLKENGIEPTILDIRDNPMSAEEIKGYIEKVGWEKLLNRKSTTWRTLSDAEKSDISNETTVNLIVKYPTLMKRPVMIKGEEIMVGFDKQAIALLEKSLG